MRPANRLRWRLTLLFTLVTLVSGVALLLLVAALSVSLPQSDAPRREGPPAPRAAAPVKPEPIRDVVPPGAVDPMDPIYPGDGGTGDIRRRVLIVPGIAVLILVPLALGFGWYVAGRMLRPIRTMTDTLHRISGRNVHERLAVVGRRDEFKDLADTVDGLLGRLETALDGHKRFVANAAHELRTPYTVEHALLEEPLIDPGATVESYRANFEQLLTVNRHRSELLESLLTLAGSESAREGGTHVDLAATATEVLAERAADLQRHGLTLDSAIRPAWAVGDPMLLTRLIANLCDNAIHYNEPGGTVEVGTRASDGYCRIIVANTGPVVPPDQVDRLFEPFQRMRRVADDGHHGLGLSIVRAIATAHGATVTARARPGGGLAVELLFPADRLG